MAKKFLSVLVCVAMLFVVVPFTAAAPVKAGGENDLLLNTWNNLTWETDEYYTYFTVPEDGFYDIGVVNNYLYNYSCDIAVEISDRSGFNFLTGHAYIYLPADGGLESGREGNVYFQAGHTYEVRCVYERWDSDTGNSFYENGDIDLCIEKNDHALTVLGASAQSVYVSPNETTWCTFTTSSAGDYTLYGLDQVSVEVYVYEKKIGMTYEMLEPKCISTWFDGTYTRDCKRMKLKANTQYIVQLKSWDNMTRMGRFSVVKDSKNVTAVTPLQWQRILADDYLDEYYFSYKITYSDSTSEILTSDACRDRGMSCYLYYNGEYLDPYDCCFMKSGTQPAILNFMDIAVSTTVYITPYATYFSHLSGVKPKEEIFIDYEDDWEHTRYVKLTPTESGLYEFYSAYWDYMDAKTEVFDSQNNLIEYVYDDDYNGGWKLIGGKTYVLRFTYTLDEYWHAEGFAFSYEQHHEHVHIYNDKNTYTCSSCGNTVYGETLRNIGGTWYYYKDGKLNNSTTLCNYGGQWWFVKNGKVDFTANNTLFLYNGEYWYIQGGKVNFNANTLCYYNNEWWHVQGGKVNFKSNTLVLYNGDYWYTQGGKVNFSANTLCPYNGQWWHVQGGKVNFKSNTLVLYNGDYWYTQGGKVNFNATTLCLYNGDYWYIQNGKVNFKANTLCPYNGQWWHVQGGKVNFKSNNTLVLYNGDYWYIQGGKINFNANTLCLYGGQWWHVQGGKVNFKSNTLVLYNGDYWYTQGGKVNFNANTLCCYGGTWWHVQGGKVNFKSNTRVMYNGKWYTVRGGKVV